MVLGVYGVVFRCILSWPRGFRIVQMGVEGKCVFWLGLDDASRQSRCQPAGSRTTSLNSRRPLTTARCSSNVAVLLLDRVPFLAPVLSLQSPEFQELAIVHNLVLRIKATLLENIVVRFEHGQECCSCSWRTLNHSFNEVDLFR